MSVEVEILEKKKAIMFRSYKQQQRSHKSGYTLDFNFSHFQALQVPKGWDKLFVSIVSVDTGKTITKSAKASVKNGSCRWPESFSDSISISSHDGLKDTHECLRKFVVSMGSTRSSVLGEATVNLTSYRTSGTAVPVSLPLKKCNYGTTLMVRIHCLTPNAELREEQLEDTGSFMDKADTYYDDMENKSDVSDISFTRSVGSSSSNHLDSASQAGSRHSRELSFSASGSRNSFESMDGSLGRDNSLPLTNNENDQIGRQDSTASQNSSSYGSYSFNDSSRSNYSSFNSKVSASRNHLQNQRENNNHVSHSMDSSPSWNANSSKDLLEAAESKIEELRIEAKMWEQNARKLMTDVEGLQKELKDQSNSRESLEAKLLESHQECDCLKQKIQRLETLLEESLEKQTPNRSVQFQEKEMIDLQKELEDEVKLQKESNASLALQLKKTQESNIELVSILQELEDTAEKQKQEISTLKTIQFRNQDGGNSTLDIEDNELMNDEILVDQAVSPQPDDKKNLELEVSQLQESQKKLESTIRFLEKSLEEKEHEIKSEKSLKTQILGDIEAGWRKKLEEKEEEINNLELTLSEVVNSDGIARGADHSLIKENEVLKQKIEELERDCNELTDENLELLLKLKETKKDLPTSHSSSHCSPNVSLENDSFPTSESEVSKNSQVFMLNEELNEKEILIKELEEKFVDLEHQLKISKDKTCLLDVELHKYRARAEERDAQIATLQQQLVSYQEKESETKDPADISTDLKISGSQAAVQMSDTLSELHEQIIECIDHLKKQKYTSDLAAISEYNYSTGTSRIRCNADVFGQRERAEAILHSFYQLKGLLEGKNIAREDEPQQSEEETLRVQNVDEIQDIFVVSDINENTLSTTDPSFGNIQMNPESDSSDSSKDLLAILESDKLDSGDLLDHEVAASWQSQHKLETQVANLLDEKRLLQEKMEIMQRDAETTSKCLEDAQKDLMLLKSSMDSKASANEILERKSSELESGKHELEIQLSELEKENVRLSERICGMEAQLRYLTEERETSRLKLQNSESCTLNLKEEITRLQGALEAQKTDMKQKLHGMQRRWLEAQEECDYLRVANQKLQRTAESLIEEFSLLEKSNGELRKQKMELNEHCSVLEAELRESEKVFSDTIKEVEALDGKYASLLEAVASKEKALILELDSLLIENKNYKEKLDAEESLLNKTYLEKIGEIENLKREVLSLRDQISASHDGKEKAASDAIFEVSRLRADKAAVEASLEEIRGELAISEQKFSTLQMESEAKLQGLVDELATSKQNQEILIADHEKLLELLEDVKSSEERQKSNVRGLELKLKASEYERQQIVEEISSLKVQLQKTVLLQNEISDLTKALNETKFEYQRLEASSQMLSDENNELKAENVTFLQKISDMQVAVSELEDCKHSKVALEEKVLRLEGDLTAREALGTQEAELKNEVAQVKRTTHELQRKIRYLEEEKEVCLKKSQCYQEEIKQMKEAEHDKCKTKDDADFQPSGEFSTIRVLTTDELKFSQVDGNGNHTSGNSMKIDPISRIQLLEIELDEALEANDMYKAQLKSLLSEERKDRVLSLEVELKELQERYLNMSLKYAEVEAEREQLVLKLKPPSQGRSWFS